MNENKVCFIVIKKDKEQYRRMRAYLSKLKVPLNMEIDVLSLENDKNVAAAYNKAMARTDAKYKIYLWEEICVLRENIVEEIMKIFQEDQQIGVLGVAGTQILPTSANWWQAKRRCGKFLNLTAHRVIQWRDVAGAYETVQAVDGCFMATQHDLPWREDLFGEDSFFDIAQSIEYSRRGYKNIVVRQEAPWCGFDAIKLAVNLNQREVFLNEYSKDVFPRVSILIPTFNRPAYFELALQSALKQTYRNIEIIVGDGSTDERTGNLMKRYSNNDTIIYFHDEGEIDRRYKKMEELSTGEYINWLMDDDLFLKEKISQMMNFYLELDGIALVTSCRRLIDQNGAPFVSDALPLKRFCDQTAIFSGEAVGRFVLQNFCNFIGEPTTALIKKCLLPQGYFTRYYGYEVKVLSDVSMWLNLLQQGNLVYISEPLSCFRMHAGQDQRNLNTMLKGAIDWLNLIQCSNNAKVYLKDKAERVQAILASLKNIEGIIRLELSQTGE